MTPANQDELSPRDRMGQVLDAHRKHVLSSLVQMMSAFVPDSRLRHEQAAELFQDVCVRALASAERFDWTRQPVPWLTQIGKHILLEQGRREQSHRRYLNELLDTPYYALPEDEIATKLDAEIIQSHIQQELTELDQKIITLRLTEWLTHEEIAMRLDMPSNNVRGRYRRALAKIRLRLNIDPLKEAP